VTTSRAPLKQQEYLNTAGGPAHPPNEWFLRTLELRPGSLRTPAPLVADYAVPLLTGLPFKEQLAGRWQFSSGVYAVGILYELPEPLIELLLRLGHLL
jgi:hypothetical protein